MSPPEGYDKSMTMDTPSRRTGSVLLITLMVVSLLLILVTSFAVFIRIELRQVVNRQQELTARKHAALALQIAVGELQVHAGADQRITAPATTVYPGKDFEELYDGDDEIGADSWMWISYLNRAGTSSSRSYLDQVGTYLTPVEREIWDQDLQSWWNSNGYHPRWTGVFNSSLRVDRASNPSSPAALPAEIYEADPDTQYSEPDRNQLPVWLISGNEQLGFNPWTDTDYPAGYFTPETPLPDPASDDSVVWLVDEGTSSGTAESVDGLDGRVKAPVVTVSNQVQRLGGYAYWVGDESTKANFAVREPDTFASSLPGSTEYRNRLQVPQRVGWERMEGFETVFEDNPGMDVNSPVFDRIITSAQIALMHEDFADPVQNSFHHVTTHSSSLLTDPLLGGLKQDLTRYLTEGAGLNDSDTIPDPNRYDPSDSRFAAHGGTNTGFPNTGTSALDGIPTWGQLRDWYLNSSTGGSTIAPDPDHGVVPVLTYLHFNGGWSYEGSTRTLRMHWAPMIVLWNPYDIGLSSGVYELEVGISPALYRCLIVDPSPSLTELQALDPGAGWGPDLNPAVDENGDGNPANDWRYVDVDGNTQIILNPAGGPDSIDLNNGPVPRDTDVSDGTSDAFGRFYYHTTPVDASVSFHEHQLLERRLSGVTHRGPLGEKRIAFRFNPHDPEEEPSTQLPVNRRMRFRIQTGFEPGQAKIFTLPLSQSWNHNDWVPLVNDYIANDPQFLWFDALTLTNGPASAGDLRFNFRDRAGHQAVASPTVDFRIGGRTIFHSKSFGEAEMTGSWLAALGRDYAEVVGYNPVGNADEDGDGLRNRDEPAPKFISRWRPLYDFFDFENHIETQTGSLTRSSNWAFNETFLRPFTGAYSLGAAEKQNLHSYMPVFSRFNLGAELLEGNPLVESTRNRNDENNFRADGSVEGLFRIFAVTHRAGDGFGGNTEVKWADGQANGVEGFTLVTPRVNPAIPEPYEGLTRIAIRNARRAESNLLSIGQFQQVNLARYFWQPAFPIGNSDASPYADREAIAGIHSRIMGSERDPNRALPGWHVRMPLPGVRPNHARATTGTIPFASGIMPSSTYCEARDGELAFKDGNNYVKKVIPMPGNTMVDMSYLLNESLWDRFMLSTIPGPSPDFSDPLPNSRHRYTEEAVSAGGDLTAVDTAAAYLVNEGALNVNSTSVEAWKALLTAFRDLSLGDNPAETAPVARTLDPIAQSVGFHFDTDTLGGWHDSEMGNVPGGKNYTNVLSGFRYLDDAMIQVLAERIVDEVRLRGPFYSVSDFVNRRLVPPSGSNQPGTPWYEARTNGIVGSESGALDDHPDYIDPDYNPFPGLHGLNGALQRALNVSGINGGINHPSMGEDGSGQGEVYDMVYSVRIRDGGNATDTGESAYTSSGIGGDANDDWGSLPAGKGYKHTQEPAMRSHLDSEHLAGSPAGEAGQLLQGAPGFVTQGDLLAMIGPALTARGDTFVIRCYGDSSGADGQIQARAWLEAVVQRTVEPVTPAGTSGADRWRPTSAFGRKYKIVRLRWLTPDEI